MNPIQRLLSLYRETGSQLEDVVLATVVHVEGSAYRQPGARMLMLASGHRCGTISGGCLEGEIAKKAVWWTSASPAALRIFDSTDQGAARAFGLGCSGIVSVLLERLAALPETCAWLDDLERSIEQRNPMGVATVIRADAGLDCAIGNRLWMAPEGCLKGTLTASEWEDILAPHLESARVARTNCLIRLPTVDVFVECIAPPQRLVIFGAGEDVIPLSEIAAVLGWSVVVAHATPGPVDVSRFPGSEYVLKLPSDGNLGAVPIDDESAVVVMTHNFPLDRLLLPGIVAKRPKYLGILGPLTRTTQLFADCGISMAQASPYSPVGLDIGGDTPEAVALAIAAEIQAVFAKREGAHLRDRQLPIHQPIAVLGEIARTA